MREGVFCCGLGSFQEGKYRGSSVPKRLFPQALDACKTPSPIVNRVGAGRLVAGDVGSFRTTASCALSQAALALANFSNADAIWLQFAVVFRGVGGGGGGCLGLAVVYLGLRNLQSGD